MTHAPAGPALPPGPVRCAPAGPTHTPAATTLLFQHSPHTHLQPQLCLQVLCGVRHVGSLRPAGLVQRAKQRGAAGERRARRSCNCTVSTYLYGKTIRICARQAFVSGCSSGELRDRWRVVQIWLAVRAGVGWWGNLGVYDYVSRSDACIARTRCEVLLGARWSPKHPGSQVGHLNAAGSWCHRQGLVLAGQGQPGEGFGGGGGSAERETGLSCRGTGLECSWGCVEINKGRQAQRSTDTVCTMVLARRVCAAHRVCVRHLWRAAVACKHGCLGWVPLGVMHSCPPSKRQALEGEAVHVAPRVADAGGGSAEHVLSAQVRGGKRMGTAA